MEKSSLPEESSSASTSAVSAPNHAASLPDPALPAPSLPADEAGFTAADLITHQARLEAQASEAIPFKFDTCTYSLGYIRQPVYSCKTCGGGGVCAGCSVSCHSEHDLVELFNKRGFRCDCGTPSLYKGKSSNSMSGKVKVEEQLEYPENAPPCSLRKPGYDPQNECNRYNHNFEGSFCYCVRGRTYDPEKEDETMFQCLVCEEWLHENCTSLRPPASQRQTASDPVDGGEPPLIDHDLFDLMICDACVRKGGNEILRDYAGSKGWMILLPTELVSAVAEHDGLNAIKVPTEQAAPDGADDGATTPAPKDEADNGASQSWQIFGLPLYKEAQDGETTVATADTGKGDETEVGAAGAKRAASPQTDAAAPEAKRTKLDGEASQEAPTTHGSQETPLCKKPKALQVVQQQSLSIASEYVPALSKDRDESSTAHRYDIFLSEDFRDRICKCESCLLKWKSLSFVLEPEGTYSPPSDPEASIRDDDAASVSSSTYDLGMAALRTMPREKMLNSLQAYSKFRDALWEHLRPFAGSGKLVSEDDVKAFFNKRMHEKDA